MNEFKKKMVSAEGWEGKLRPVNVNGIIVMEANAPEKIYLNKNNKTLLDILSVKDTERIEYTRTDAFIEKACEWLENNLQGIVGGSIYIEDFRKYMEGEKV